MGKKRLKDIFKRTLAGVLSATMVLGMTFTGTVSNVQAAEPTYLYGDDGEYLGKGTDTAQADLGPGEINIITSEYTNDQGNAIPYSQNVTYVAGYVQTGPETEIDYLKGLKMNIKFDRELNYLDEEPEAGGEEGFVLLAGKSVNIFGNTENESRVNIQLSTYATDDKMTYESGVTDKIYNMTEEDLNTKYSTTQKPMAFIIALYNLKQDVGISYSFPTRGNGYCPVGAVSSTTTVKFDDGEIHIKPTTVEVKSFKVAFDTDTNKNKLTVGKDFTVTKPADQTLKDTEGEEKIDTTVEGGIAPKITETTAGYEVAGWYTDEACTDAKKFDMDTAITESLYNWNSKTGKSDANNDTLKLYAKYTPKTSAELTVHCYLDGSTTEVRPTADQTKLNKKDLTFGTTESVTAPTVTGYKLKEDTTTPASVTIDSMKKEHTFYYTASDSTNYKVRIHKTKLNSDQTETYEGGETVDVTLSDGTSGQSKTIVPATLETGNETYKNAVAGFEYDADKTGTANLTKTIAADGSTIFDVYYSRKSYTVTFDTQTEATKIGATADPMDPSDPVLYGGLVPDPGTVTFTGADGYEFTGWATKDGDTYTAWDLDTDTVEGPVTLFAQYGTKGDVAYTVRYLLKGTTTKIKEDGNGTGKFNEKITPAINVPAITGYTFDADYSASAEVNGAALADIVLDKVGKIIYLYYTGDETTYTIETYKQNTAGNGYDKDAKLTVEKTAHVGDVITAITPAAVEGFTFESGNTNNKLEGTVLPNKGLVLKVYYTRNTIAITFNPDGNKPSGATIDKSKLDPDKLTQNIPYETSPADPGDPATTGYEFKGWSTDGTPEKKVTPGTTTLTKGETLVPIWEAKTDAGYTVKYYLEGTTTAVPGTTVKNVTGKTFNTEQTETAPEVDGYTAKAPTTQKITLDAYNKELVFYYTANEVTYDIERYEMNVNGSYDGVTPKTTSKTGKVGEEVKATIDAATAEFEHDETAAGKVESGTIPATDKLVLKVYYSRKQYTVTFDVTSSKTITENSATLSAVASQTVYYGATATAPAANPTVTGAPGMNFGGWFTEADGTTKYTFGTAITGNTTIYAQLTDKEISLSFDDDALSKADGIYRRYLIGGPDAVGGNAADKGRKGDQLNFTLTVDGVTLKTTEYDSYEQPQKDMLDSVTFDNKMIGGFEKITDKNSKGESFRVADIAAGGMASARYAGVQEVTLNYLGTNSTNTAKIVLPGDTNCDGMIAVADLTNMASILRGTLTAKDFGEAEPYIPYLIDVDGDGSFIIADISDAASMVRGVSDYSNSFKPADDYEENDG